MSSEAGEPAAKRVRLDPEQKAPPAQAPAPSSSSSNLIPTFINSSSTGLYGVLAPSLGKRAANEEEVGVTEYVSASVEPFSGIIKHRFTDFLVYEVGLDGEVVRLKDIDGPAGGKRKEKGKMQEQSEAEPVKEVAPPAAEASTAVVAEAAPLEKAKEEEKPVEQAVSLWTPEAEALVTPLFLSSPAKFDEFKAFVESHTGAKQGKGVFVTEPIPDKALRGQFHKTLREAFSSKFVSAHKDNEGGEPSVEVKWAGSVAQSGAKKDNKRSRDQRDRDQADRPDLSSLPPYIHFTLLKSNKESHDAMFTLARYFNLSNQRDLGVAGTKDKRAVTVQRVSLKRGRTTTIEDIYRAAKSGGAYGGGRGGRGGRGGAKFGRGRGGGFGSGGFIDRAIRIGDVEYAESGLELGMLKGNKFVVTLRDVQTPSIPTIHDSLASLRTHGFINYYGMQRFGTAPVPTHVVGLALLRGEWQLAIELIMSIREGEQQDMHLARMLWQEGKTAEAARQMPRRAVAEKSLLDFFQRSKNKDYLGALSTIPKNLRMMYVHAWQSYIWNRVLSERVKLFGAKEPVEGDLVYVDEAAAEEGVVEDGEGAEQPEAAETPATSSSSNPQQAAYAAKSRIAKVRALTADDIASGKHTIYDVVLPLPGFAVTYPAGELGEVYKRVIKEDGIDAENMWRKQKEYSLGGTYRKILYLPKDVSYRLLISTSANEDLAQSDEDGILNRPAPTAREYAGEELAEGESLALQVELTLGSSTYATMALREVLKSRTSSANQKSLTEQMEARLKKDEEIVEKAEAPAVEAAEETPEPKMEVEQLGAE
ncbi:hypothetical protein JCM8547_001245 [Rhodosporidiobolus lusitaniae]